MKLVDYTSRISIMRVLYIDIYIMCARLCMTHYLSGGRQKGMSESQDCCVIRKSYLQVQNV